MSIAKFYPLFGLLGLLACTGSAGDNLATSSVDSAGVAIVTSSAEDRELDWVFTRELVLGGADAGPESFSSASHRVVRSNGQDRIAVLDGDAHQVHIFDDSGAHLQSAGGKGAGPGEFSMAFDLLDAGVNRIALSDFGRGAILAWDWDGNVLIDSTRDQGLGMGRIAMRDDELTISLVERDSINSTTRLVIMEGTDTTELASLTVQSPGMVELSCVALMLEPMFAPRLIWSTTGERIASAITSAYNVNIYEAGVLVRSVRRDKARIPTSENDALREYPDGWNVTFGGGGTCRMEGDEVAEKAGISEFLPVISAAVLSPDGGLWVERHSFPNDTAQVDVFDPEGAYLGTLTGMGLPLGWLSNDRIMFAEVDEATGIETVVIYRVVDGS